MKLKVTPFKLVEWFQSIAKNVVAQSLFHGRGIWMTSIYYHNGKNVKKMLFALL